MLIKKIKWRYSVSALILAGAMFLGMSSADNHNIFIHNAHAEEVKAGSTISSCLITSDKNSIEIKAENSGGSDRYYLFELKAYEDNIGSRTDYIESFSAGAVNTVIPLNHGTEADRLYSSFVMAIKSDNKFIEVSNPRYITNPEIIAKNTAPFNDPLTKKGLNIEINMLEDAFELGVKHVGTNIAFHQILGEGIEYTYDGKTYHFSKDVIESYDKTISALSGKSMTVTAIILNGYNPAEPDLFHKGAVKRDDIFYYMFNVDNKEGFEKTRAIASFLAERYNGSDPNHGKISNWIIGNEINNQQWNYIGEMDVHTYAREYEKAFRLFYSAIKSVSANDRVYFSLDFHWNADSQKDGKFKYGGKEIVDHFNSVVEKKGNISWGLAYHPYPFPMTEPEFWDDKNTGLVTNDINSPVINFINLNVLTDYFNQEALKAPTGLVRNIILTEQGFTANSASRGDVPYIQAAAYAYSYYLVDSNPFIQAYILSRQVDAPSEVNQGISFGLWKCDMSKPDQIVATSRRKIWQVFKNIDKKDYTLENTEFAKSIIGIEKWSDIIPDFRWKSLEK